MEGTTESRILSLDVLRGIALLGLPLMNIVHFAMPSAAYLNPYAYAESHFLHHEIFIFLSIFADQKFMGLFTMLFGAGLVLLYQKNTIYDGKPARRHYARMFMLLLLGSLHYWYVWDGDILTFYAILGMLIYPLHKLNRKILFILSALFFVISMSTAHVKNVNSNSLGQEHFNILKQYYQPSESFINERKSLFLGNYEDVMVVNRGQQNTDIDNAYVVSSDAENSSATVAYYSILLSILFKMLAMIILGIALFKSGLFYHDISHKTLMKLGGSAATLGVLITILSLVANYANAWNIEFYFEYGYLLKELGSVPMAFAYLCFGIILANKGKHLVINMILANVGKMALTNYLLQSVICFVIFYGPGLGLHGEVSRAELLTIVIGIWAFQILFSNIWLKYFIQGPIEWCWRTCSAMRLQTLLIRA